MNIRDIRVHAARPLVPERSGGGGVKWDEAAVKRFLV